MSCREKIKMGVLALAMAVGGCDCEEQARSLLYGGGDSTEVKGSLSGDDGDGDKRNWEVEPNDSAQDATPIRLSNERRPMYGTIDPEDDVDWFSLHVDDDESWLVELTVEPKDSELDLAIYLEVPGDGDWAPLMYDVAGAGEAESIPMLDVPSDGPGDGPRRFFIAGSNGTTGEYRIDVRKRLSAATVAVAPNDHPHLAPTLEVPGEIQGFYDRPHDRDVFYVSAESLRAGIYTLELSAIGGLSQTLRIYGDEALETPLMEIPVGERVPAVIPNLSLQARQGEGLYFVLQAGESFDRQNGYRLRLIEHPVEGDYVVEREPNDTAETAQLVELNEAVRGYIHTAGDVDRFRFVIDEPQELEESPQEEQEEEEEFDEYRQPPVGEELEEQQVDEPSEVIDPWEAVPDKERPHHVVQVRLRPLGDAHRFAMRWLPEDGADGEEWEVRAGVTDEELVICNQVLEAGRYDVEVRSLETEEGFRTRSYDYQLEFIDIAGIEELEIEPNDTPEQADRLPVGESRTGFIATEGDVDVYAFVVGPDEPYEEAPEEQAPEEQAPDEERAAGGQPSSGWEAPEVERVGIHLQANSLNLGFRLLDDEGGRVAHVNEAGPGSDETLHIDLPHGLYYAAVSASSGSQCEPYKIEVTSQ